MLRPLAIRDKMLIGRVNRNGIDVQGKYFQCFHNNPLLPESMGRGLCSFTQDVALLGGRCCWGPKDFEVVVWDLGIVSGF